MLYSVLDSTAIADDPEKRLLVEQLGSVMPTESVPDWLFKPNSGFQDEKPIDLILRGDYEPIRRMIYEVDSGQPT